MHIDLDGIPVALFRKKIKNLNLRITPSGEVQISAPMKTALALIHRFLDEKKAWIHKHRVNLQSQSQMTSPTFNTGEMLFFLGFAYPIQVHPMAKKNDLIFEEGVFNFHIKSDTTLTQKQALLSKWYEAKMRQCLPALFEKWQTIIGVEAYHYRMRTMKSRWGSCHPIKKEICLNLRLMEKPAICLEYIIVHELVHLLEASHNQRFHAFMSQFMPNWKEIKRLLNGINTHPRREPQQNVV